MNENDFEDLLIERAIGDLTLLKDNEPIALFLLNNIAGFKEIWLQKRSHR